MYLYRFETDADFKSAYKGEDYSEPWVSCTDENHQVNYNYKPHITIRVKGAYNNIERTFVLQKYTAPNEESDDFYYFPISTEALWNLFGGVRVNDDNHLDAYLFDSTASTFDVNFEPDSVNENWETGQVFIHDSYALNDGTPSENITNINNVETKYYDSGTWNVVAIYNQEEQKFEIFDDRLIDGAIAYDWSQMK